MCRQSVRHAFGGSGGLQAWPCSEPWGDYGAARRQAQTRTWRVVSVQAKPWIGPWIQSLRPALAPRQQFPLSLQAQ